MSSVGVAGAFTGIEHAAVISGRAADPAGHAGVGQGCLPPEADL